MCIGAPTALLIENASQQLFVCAAGALSPLQGRTALQLQEDKTQTEPSDCLDFHSNLSKVSVFVKSAPTLKVCKRLRGRIRFPRYVAPATGRRPLCSIRFHKRCELMSRVAYGRLPT